MTFSVKACGWNRRASILLLVLLSLLSSSGAMARVQRSFVNLSFELPQISNGAPCRAYVDYNDIPGWITNHPFYTWSSGNISCPPGYIGPTYTGSARIVEMWRGPRDVSGGQGQIEGRSGEQFAELNAESHSELTQEVCLLEGEQVEWRFSHNGRNSTSDEMVFRVGSEDVVQATTSRTGDGSQSCLSGVCNPVESQQTTTGTYTRWADYSGTFTYSQVTGDTVVGFEGAGGTGTSGNFLDDIQLVLKPVVEFESKNFYGTEGAVSDTKMEVVVLGTVPAGGMTLEFNVDPASTAVIGVDYWINGGTNTEFSVFVPAGEYEAFIIEIPVTVRTENGLQEEDKWFDVALAESPDDYNLVSSTACGAVGNALSRFTIMDAPLLSGHVFIDDGSGSGASAGNGLKEGGEAGRENVEVRVLGKDGLGQCDAGDVLATTQTDSDGFWLLQLSGEYIGDSVCVETALPAWGYESTSESIGDADPGEVTPGIASDDLIELNVPDGGTRWTDINFGDELSPNMCETGSGSSGGGVASGGSGPYREAIYWLDWNCLGKTSFEPADVIMKNWVFGPVEIRATISGITGPLAPYSTGSWSGDVLDDLYSGVNPIGLANVDGSNPQFRIDWQVYLNGRPIPAEIIIADAEDTDDGESLVAETNGTPWELFAVGPGTDDLALSFENSASRLVVSSLPGNGIGSFLAMTQNATSTWHTINASGAEAMAFGVFVQKDHGDIAAGYQESGGHFASQVAQGGGKPAVATDVNTIPLATLVAPLPYLGVTPPDPEDADQNSPNADADGLEEDGVTFSALVSGSRATLDIVVTENAVGQGYLQGWIDWNSNAVLGDAGEQVALNVQDNGPQDLDSTAGNIRLNVFVPPGAVVGDTYARFRFSDTANVPASGMLVLGGEVEDYKVTVVPVVTASTLSGWVFEDNGVGATAHDGQKGDDEPGLADVPVVLYHDADNNGECSGSDPVLASATTNGDGSWQLVTASADVGKNACLVAATPGGLVSVSESSGAAGASVTEGVANDDVMLLVVPPDGTVWDGILFGDVGMPILEADQQGVVAAGGSRFYTHRFTARSVGSVGFTLQAASTSPAAPAWSDTLYRDSNCDGELNGADDSLPLSAVNVQAGDQLCLLVKTFAPADAPVGALHSRPLLAVQAYTGSAFQASAQVVDTTRIAAGELQLDKSVQNLTAGSAEGRGNQAKPGEVLRYRLTFRNQGRSALTEVVVSDSTPAFTALDGPVSCPPIPLPALLTACAINTPDGTNVSGYRGSLEWVFTGELQPGAEGVVSYEVRVDE